MNVYCITKGDQRLQQHCKRRERRDHQSYKTINVDGEVINIVLNSGKWYLFHLLNGQGQADKMLGFVILQGSSAIGVFLNVLVSLDISRVKLHWFSYDLLEVEFQQSSDYLLVLLVIDIFDLCENMTFKLILWHSQLLRTCRLLISMIFSSSKMESAQVILIIQDSDINYIGMLLFIENRDLDVTEDPARPILYCHSNDEANLMIDHMQLLGIQFIAFRRVVLPSGF